MRSMWYGWSSMLAPELIVLAVLILIYGCHVCLKVKAYSSHWRGPLSRAGRSQDEFQGRQNVRMTSLHWVDEAIRPILPVRMYVLGNLSIAGEDERNLEKWFAEMWYFCQLEKVKLEGRGIGRSIQQILPIRMDVLGNLSITDQDERNLEKWFAGMWYFCQLEKVKLEGQGIGRSIRQILPIRLDVLRNLSITGRNERNLEELLAGLWYFCQLEKVKFGGIRYRNRSTNARRSHSNEDF